MFCTLKCLGHYLYVWHMQCHTTEFLYIIRKTQNTSGNLDAHVKFKMTAGIKLIIIPDVTHIYSSKSPSSTLL